MNLLHYNSSQIKTNLFYLKKFIKPSSIATYRSLIRNQKLSSDELFSLNWKKRRKLVKYAYHNVPFYHSRFIKVGIHPEDIKEPDDFSKIPFLTKQDVRTNADSLISSDVSPRQLLISTTGGSTGVPLTVYHDRRFPQECLGWRMVGWWGVEMGIDQAVVWRPFAFSTERQRIMAAIRQWPTRRVFLDATSMPGRDIHRFVKEFNVVRPKMLQGYAGGVDRVALYIEKRGLKVHSPDAIWMTSSPISTVQRKHVESVFRAPVYDQYGACEVFFMASQCREQKHLHIYSDSRHIEFVDDSGTECPEGVYGEIAVTDLDNYAFPLIRYLNGDVGRSVAGSCSCGMNFPLMDRVKGRVSDMIRTPDGTCLIGDYMTTIFDEFPEAVRQFQVYQRADFSIDIYVVKNPGFPTASQALETVRKNIIHKTRGQIPVEIVEVNEISSDRGKTRFVISEIN